MKILERLKKFLRKIFVDYNEIKRISDRNFNEVTQMNNNLVDKINLLNNNLSEMDNVIISNQNELETKIINLKKQNEVMKNELEKVKKQFSYYNLELANIKRDEKNKNIIIIGFYGAPNLGDELMLETLLDYLEDIPNKRITVLLADNPEYSIDKYKDVNFLHYPTTLYDFNIIAEQYDYIIFGGGAIIDDKQYENEEAYRYDLGTILIKMSIRAIAFNKKVICLALSSSKKLKNNEYLEKLKYIIQNSYYFSVRDEYSRKYLIEKLGKECEGKIVNISDIVLANKKILDNIRKKNKLTNQMNIGIAWISNDDNLEKIKFVLNTINDYCGNLKIKCQINLIPFYEYKRIDTNFYKKLKHDEYENLEMNFEKYPEDMKKTIEIFNKNDVIIGMRYHSILLSHALNIPCISICYDIHEHYMYKIKHLNEIFYQEEALSYVNLEISRIKEQLNLFNKKDIEENYRISKKISLIAQREIEEIIKNII